MTRRLKLFDGPKGKLFAVLEVDGMTRWSGLARECYVRRGNGHIYYYLCNKLDIDVGKADELVDERKKE